MYHLPVWVTNLALIGPFGAAVLFAILYTAKAPWWQSWMGRNLFFFDIAVAMALTPDFLHVVFGFDDGTKFFQWLIAGDLLLVALLIVQRIYLLFREQQGWNWVRAERNGDSVALPDVPAGVNGRGESS